MDRVRALLPILKKHHFWLLSAVVVVAAAVAWSIGSAGLNEQYESELSRLQSRFDSVSAIGRQPNHPNDSFIQAVAEQHKKLKAEVFKAWQILHANQQKILEWPDFYREGARLAPDEEIPESIRDQFLNYFAGEFPELFETVKPLKAAENVDEDGAAGDLEGVVSWDQSQQNDIVEAYAWINPPSTTAIRFAQEDYWVYKALLRIIDRTNNAVGATANYNAAVKTINNLQIAQAAERPKTTLPFTGDASTAQPAGAGASSPPPPGVDTNDFALEKGRYVDAEGNPLSSASDGPFAEFKLMPVLIEVVMDQRKIPLLLAECANSELPVEVHQVQINPGAAGPGGGIGKSRTSALLPAPGTEPTHQFMAYVYRQRDLGDGGGRTRQGQPQQGRPALLGRNRGGRQGQAVKSDYDVTVEIWGLIYIFERPDVTKLGIDEALEAELARDDAASETETSDGGDG